MIATKALIRVAPDTSLGAVDARIVKQGTPLNNAHHSCTVIVGTEGGLDWLPGLPDLQKLVLILLSVGEDRGKYENGNGRERGK